MFNIQDATERDDGTVRYGATGRYGALRGATGRTLRHGALRGRYGAHAALLDTGCCGTLPHCWGIVGTLWRRITGGIHVGASGMWA